MGDAQLPGAPQSKRRKKVASEFLRGMLKVMLAAGRLHVEVNAATIKVDAPDGWVEHVPTGERTYTITVWDT